MLGHPAPGHCSRGGLLQRPPWFSQRPPVTAARFLQRPPAEPSCSCNRHLPSRPHFVQRPPPLLPPACCDGRRPGRRPPPASCHGRRLRCRSCSATAEGEGGGEGGGEGEVAFVKCSRALLHSALSCCECQMRSSCLVLRACAVRFYSSAPAPCGIIPGRFCHFCTARYYTVSVKCTVAV